MAEPRTPPDTARAMREGDGALLALAVGMSEGSMDSFILGQESAGQREMVNSDVIPTELLRCTEDELTALGFGLGEQVPGDSLFRYATLPPGWKREGSGHDMWSYILDADGYRRCSVFYKAAFYDRKAHLSIDTVKGYVSTCLWENETPRVTGEWATREAVLEAIAELRAYEQEQIEFWTRHGHATYPAEHAEKDKQLTAMAEAVSQP